MLIKDLNNTLKDMGNTISFNNLSPHEIQDFKETLELIEGFKQKSRDYLDIILNSKYLKSVEEWDKILSEEDKEKNSFNLILERRSKYCLFFFCYKKRVLYRFSNLNYGCTSFGYSDINKNELFFGKKNNLVLDIHVTVFHNRLATSMSDPASLYVDINLDTDEVKYKYSPAR